MFSFCPALILAPSKHANIYRAKTCSLTFSSPYSTYPFPLRNTENYKLPPLEQIKRWCECLSGITKSYKLFSFFTFSQCQEEYSPITLLRVTFSVWRQCLHRLYSVYHYTSPYKEAAGLGGGKKDQVTEAVSFTVKGGTKIVAHLSPVNWNKSSNKTPVCGLMQ